MHRSFEKRMKEMEKRLISKLEFGSSNATAAGKDSSVNRSDVEKKWGPALTVTSAGSKMKSSMRKSQSHEVNLHRLSFDER